MSKSHQLSVNRFTDVEKYTSMKDEYEEPELPEFTPKEHLKSWLMDPQARDQLLIYRGKEAGIYWNRKTEKLEEVYVRSVSSVFYSSIIDYRSIDSFYHRIGHKTTCNGLLLVAMLLLSMHRVLHCGVVLLGLRLYVSIILVSDLLTFRQMNVTLLHGQASLSVWHVFLLVLLILSLNMTKAITLLFGISRLAHCFVHLQHFLLKHSKRP